MLLQPASTLGQRHQVGFGFSTILGDMDFETYSECGYLFDKLKNKWVGLPGAPQGKKGLQVVGAPAYSEHESTEVVSLAYNLKDGQGERLWLPGMPLPYDLFDYIADNSQLPLEAWNVSFEYLIWLNVCQKRLGWPPLPLHRLACAMAKAKAFGLPAKLEKAAEVLHAPEQKDKAGDNLIRKLSVPRNPTKNIPFTRLTPETNPEDFQNFYTYNLQDIRAEEAVSILTPDLTAYERQVWLFDQRVNMRGAPIDTVGLEACRRILNLATEKYTAELDNITRGAVPTAASWAKMIAWLKWRGCVIPNVQKDTCESFIKNNPGLPDDVRRVLEIRIMLGSNSVKKVYAIINRLSRDGRLRDLFKYYGAERTGRFAGAGAQPQNLPSSGPEVRQCDHINGCGKHYLASLTSCPWCGTADAFSEKVDWCPEAVDDALEIMQTGDLDAVERMFGDPVATIGGCLRGLFCAPEGSELLASDYTAIEGVVSAALAGEEWRLEVFRTHGRIYEMSAAKITGIPFADFMKHKGYTDITSPNWWEAKTTGSDHPLRKKIGKVAELASGFQGSVNAWKAFGADDFFKNDDEILDAVRAWRRESPNIVRMWYGLEDAAKNAIRSPGYEYSYREITYFVFNNVLFCRLPSGRLLAYQRPRLRQDTWDNGKPKEVIVFEGWNSDSTKGPVGWLTFDTFGGRLFENVVQAVARDIMVHGMLNLDKAGYPIVLHVHDEPVAEVVAGTGSISELEWHLMDLPDWCKDWPIKAAGGWRGRRYRKD